ncbi:alpha/beta hydrolase [Bacteriovorax stolpii]|uniref:Uncharacterized protein n=1 Tax=Bacteriovorax stolpii TaxID=960 RepID=A0A2K9NR10_BACTC|nr:alpha/beta hydrolase [Bacteriovorax stolpii]AUN97932.1 hypothetical protein C0V70_07390 [Bacteriovorax stolpii]QDK42082.1 alpha/beta hydrolase [Bacteriovorax stolpii]TDP51763.1 proline iminopeptidase [Bacteriovorax stolpii]
MKLLAFTLASFLLAGKTFGFTLNPVYKNGLEVCQEHTEERSGEFFRYTSVPVNYQNPLAGQTLIYSYLKKAFNPKLPSVIFFTGGPGVSSRSSEFALEHYNVIFFEQRGISCSRPASEELFLDPTFYSTENTARDAALVARAYGLSLVSAYGHSYGTVAATVFASFYPELVKSLVLEGVVYKADKTLWRDPKKLRLIQDFFNQLPVEMKSKILKLSNTPGIPASWFSKVANMMMYLNNGLGSYQSFLEQVLLMDEESFSGFIHSFYGNPEKQEEEFSFGDVTMGMIGCQEMSMADTTLSMVSVFAGEQLTSNLVNEDQRNFCAPLNISHDQNRIYDAKKYPVSVPVSYLLGETDGATPLYQGLAHFNQVAKGQKQALILLKGGHLPMLDLLKENRLCHDPEDCQKLSQNRAATQVIERLLSGQMLKQTELEDFNGSGELKWKSLENYNEQN